MATAVKNPPVNAGDLRDAGSIPGSRRSPGEGNGNPLQLILPGKFHGQRSLVGCIVHAFTKSQTRLRLDFTVWMNIPPILSGLKEQRLIMSTACWLGPQIQVDLLTAGWMEQSLS